MPKQKAVKDRLDDKLAPRELSQIRETLVDYLSEENIDPATVRFNMAWLKKFILILEDEYSQWCDLDEEDIKSTHEAIKQLHDHLKVQFSNHHKLMLDI